ncbi:MAG: murein transglycosylase [Bdellovibrio sp.]|nr:murein transglycosylase [Bdellovibrio sp.]
MAFSQAQIVSLLLLPFVWTACAATKSSDGLAMTPTIYYKPTIQNNKTSCSSSSLRDLLSPDGYTLVTMCEADYKECLMQGSCFVEENETRTSYNYHSTKDGVARFIKVDLTKCPYGYGVRSSCLDPYFSAAADLKFHSPGDVIFIPRLVGAVMPTGEVHDGFIVIRDSGGGITGESRFDFFTGFLDHKQKANTLARLGFGDPKNLIEYRKATNGESVLARERRNYPGLKKSLMRED